jgi:GAF domain-containing protein
MPLTLDRSRLLKQLIQIGIGLTSERDIALLPARILTEARRFTHAEAGTLYLRDVDRLRFAAVQNDVLARRVGEREMRRLFEAELPLATPSLAGHVVLSREILRLADAYEIPAGRPYAFNRAIDAQTGYRTRSVLVVPLMEPTGNVVGVFQLINALDARDRIVPFDPECEELIRAFASLATVALRNAQLEEVARGRAAVRFVASLALTTAHEINHPLSAITANIQLLAKDVSDPVSRQRIEAALGAVETIREIVERMNRITELKVADQAPAQGPGSRQ